MTEANRHTLDMHASTGAAFMLFSDLFGDAAWSFTGNVNETAAKAAAKAVAVLTVGEWPRWQISYAFDGGSTKTATLRPIYQDAEGEWHKLGAWELKDAFLVTDVASQLTDIIAPAGAQKVGLILEDYTDSTITVKVRGVA